MLGGRETLLVVNYYTERILERPHLSWDLGGRVLREMAGEATLGADSILQTGQRSRGRPPSGEEHREWF